MVKVNIVLLFTLFNVFPSWTCENNFATTLEFDLTHFAHVRKENRKLTSGIIFCTVSNGLFVFVEIQDRNVLE